MKVLCGVREGGFKAGLIVRKRVQALGRVDLKQSAYLEVLKNIQSNLIFLVLADEGVAAPPLRCQRAHCDTLF